MCDKAFDKCHFVFGFSINFRLEKCFNDTKNCFCRSFKSKYCHDRWKTQNMCDESVDDCLAVLTFVVSWNVSSKIL